MFARMDFCFAEGPLDLRMNAIGCTFVEVLNERTHADVVMQIETGRQHRSCSGQEEKHCSL